MDLSVVIPLWNEQRRIAAAIAAVAAEVQALGAEFEILCVDDGSSDATADLIDGCARRDPRIRLLRLQAHRGKGAAVRAGVLAARGQLVCFLDADLSVPARAIGQALPLLLAGADVVRGSRHCDGARVLRRQGAARRVFGRLFLALTRTWTDPSATDLTCGFKGYRRAAALAIFARCRLAGWAFDAEAAWVARRLGFVTRELPVEWTHDPDSRVRLPSAVLGSAVELARLALRQLHSRAPRARLRQV
jgi:dolichyl-phosphate beta-glucosyltransferase